MSTLKTHNLQSPDASSVNIALTPNSGAVISGITTITKGTSGGATANTDSVLILDNSSHSYIQFRTPNNKEQGILFGDDADNDAGNIIYDHSDNALTFATNGGTNERLRITSTGNVIIAETMAVNRPRIVLSAPDDGTNYRHLFGANLQVDSSGTFTTPTANISGGGWEYLPANSLNAHGHIRYLSAPDTNATTSTPEERLRIDATGRVLIGVDATTNSDSYVQAFKKTGNDATITVGNVGVSSTGLCRYDFAPSNKVVGARIECRATEDFSTAANRTSDLVFLTRKDGTLSDKLHITSDGHIGIGGDHWAKLVVTEDSSNTSLTGHNYLASQAGMSIDNSSNTTGSFNAYTSRVKNAGGTQQSASLAFKSTSSGFSPEIHLTQRNGSGSQRSSMIIYSSGAIRKPENPIVKTSMSSTYGSSGSLTTNTANVGILQAAAYIDRGDNGWTTSGSNAYTFVCPVDGIYVVHAHVSYGNGISGRQIWVMSYTLGGGNLPLSAYVEVMDHTSASYANFSYYDTYNFTAGTRLGFGRNSGSGSLSGQSLQWGCHLLQ